MRILFVCLGNICRSPLMEGLSRAACTQAGVPHAFDSAGLGAWHAGEPPDPRAVAVARRHGLDIGDQRARVVTAADFERHDWLLAADRPVLAQLRARAPRGARAELALFLDWTGAEPGAEVPDPYTGDARDFERVYAQVAAAAQALAAKLRRG
jgi:protein-tyrosine phosphatase